MRRQIPRGLPIRGPLRPRQTRLRGIAARVDIIPPSLAIAQAAEESGWGTSRFAQEGNALFGQRAYEAHRGGIVPNRPEGKKFKVRAFDHLIDGVKAYVHNLNSHSAYEDFRGSKSVASCRYRSHRRICAGRVASALFGAGRGLHQNNQTDHPCECFESSMGRVWTQTSRVIRGSRRLRASSAFGHVKLQAEPTPPARPWAWCS